jgi:hypothetical protein
MIFPQISKDSGKNEFMIIWCNPADPGSFSSFISAALVGANNPLVDIMYFTINIGNPSPYNNMALGDTIWKGIWNSHTQLLTRISSQGMVFFLGASTRSLHRASVYDDSRP